MKPNFELNRVILENREEISSAWELYVAHRRSTEPDYNRGWPTKQATQDAETLSLATASSGGWLLRIMTLEVRQSLNLDPTLEESIASMLVDYEKTKNQYLIAKYDTSQDF